MEVSNRKMNNSMIGQQQDMNELIAYVKELEINLAKKNEQLAAKDQQINTLEAAVQGQVFRGVDIAAPLLKRSGKKHLVATPNQVSDVSGDAEEESEESLGLSRSCSLSQISKVNSSEDDSSHNAKDDGRWNIPFFPSFDNSVVGGSETEIKSPRHEHALKDIAFIPIGATEMERRLSGDTVVTIRRPVAVRKSLGNIQNKENRSPKTRSRHSIDSVGAPFSIR